MGSGRWKQRWKQRWRTSRFAIVTVAIAVFFMVIAFLFGTVGSPGPRVSSELRKYFMQFFLVTALGALVGVVVYEYRRRREAADQERQRRREASDQERQRRREASERERQRAVDAVASVLRQLDAIYRSVKTIRRQLRLSQARAPSNEKRGELGPVTQREQDKQAYVEALLKLDEDQQDLEQLAHDLEVLERQARSIEQTRADHLCKTRKAIKDMEKYLGALWREREDVAARSEEEFELINLTRLSSFLARVATGKSDFYELNGKYHEARRELIEVLADTRLTRQEAELRRPERIRNPDLTR